jgi:hypothetical protein
MMRRTWILLIVVAVALVGALPATAKKPDKPEPPPRAPIEVSLNTEPLWVHEAADNLRYVVTLENKTATAINHLTVAFTAAGTTEEVTDIEVPANGAISLDGFSRLAGEFAETAECIAAEVTCDLVASTAVYDDQELLAETSLSTMLDPEPPCAFDEDGVADVAGVCIWTLGEGDATGVWEISFLPTPPANPKRSINAALTVRDGVPGNWCTLEIGTGSAIAGRWKVGDGPLVGEVYLPGDENLATLGLDTGTCLGGGAGGDYFAVGNPNSFYLAANAADGGGTVSATWKRPLP